MTIGELFEKLKGIPLSSDFDVCDFETGEHPEFVIDTTSNQDYESGQPIVTLYLHQSGDSYV